MIFAQMLEIVALSDLASVLCARKFSFAPHFFIYYYNFIIIIIIIVIFKALRLAAVVFMCFLFWPPPRDLSIARLFKNGQTPQARG